jgi:hypothetical protein
LVLGAAGGLALGYTLDHFLGDSDYSGKEMFVDATTGALGGGLVNPVIRVGSRANKVIRHTGGKAYKVGAGATESLLVAGYVTKPMISRPVRMEMLAGAAAGLVYDIAYGKSSGSSSEQNGTHVGPGGIPSSYRKPDQHYRKLVDGTKMKKITCPPDYELVEWKGKLFCRPEKAFYPRSKGRIVRNSRRYSWKSM